REYADYRILLREYESGAAVGCYSIHLPLRRGFNSIQATEPPINGHVFAVR
ncbi:MAG: hypothetical protein QOI41_5598, partial [Myxococcales bacterium]|nr:hypothetical protein [Myxococcales bacterium]